MKSQFQLAARLPVSCDVDVQGLCPKCMKPVGKWHSCKKFLREWNWVKRAA